MYHCVLFTGVHIPGFMEDSKIFGMSMIITVVVMIVFGIGILILDVIEGILFKIKINIIKKHKIHQRKKKKV